MNTNNDLIANSERDNEVYTKVSNLLTWILYINHKLSAILI